MNRTLAILLLFLSVLFTACQSDEPAIDEGGGKTDGMNIGYIAVNIVQPSSVGARSRTETTGPANGFEYGSDAENKAEKALFFLFKETTNNSTPVYEVNGKPFVEINVNGSGTGTSPEVERIYNTVLVIDGVDSDPTQEVKSIVCVLNAPDALKSTEETQKIKTLEQLNQLIGEYGSSTAGTFIMTNSVYTSDGNITTPTSKTITKGNKEEQETLVKKSAAEAQQKPVEIYVERVVAKVEASFKSGSGSGSGNDGFKNEGAKPTIDGVETQLGITITGIEVANIAKKSYLFKSVSGASTASDGIWKESNVFDATNKRSYWETVPALGTGGMQLDNKSYETIVSESVASTPSTTEEGGTAGGGEGTEESTSLSSIVDTYTNNKFFTYIQPNTLEDDATNKKIYKTCILVTAQLTKNNQPITDLTYIRGGYTTQTKALNVVAAYLAKKEYYKKIEETGQSARYEQLSAGDLEWKNRYSFAENSNERTELSWLKDYEVVAQIKGEVTKLYNSSGEEISNGVNVANKHLRAATTEDAIAKNYRARVFTNGKCYYFMEIDHSSVLGKSAGTYPGVVRNHIYRLTLESIQGIGTPVFNPKDLIIPQTPDNETTFYLGARVNVLAWKLATQNVNFEGN